MSAAAVESFLAALDARGRAPNTVAAYRRDLLAYVAYLSTAGLPLDAVTDADVEGFAAHLEEKGRKPSSIARALVAVRALHRFRYESGAAPTDPARQVSRAPGPAAPAAVLSVAEVARLLDAVAGDDAHVRRDRAMLELLYGGALRPSEVVALDRTDVDASGLVRLRGRRGEVRAVPAGAAAGVAVATWNAPGGRDQLVAGGWSQAADRAALFLNHQGRRLTRQGVWLVLRRWATAAGLADTITPQALRHACVVHLEEAGMPAHLVREFLGGPTLPFPPNVPLGGDLVEAHRRFHPRNRGEGGR